MLLSFFVVTCCYPQNIPEKLDIIVEDGVLKPLDGLHLKGLRVAIENLLFDLFRSWKVGTQKLKD